MGAKLSLAPLSHKEHLRRTSLGFINVIVLDNVGLHKVANILKESPMIEPALQWAPSNWPQQICTFSSSPLIHPS
ncbi:hypothetical protein DSO57_1004048 [Entomophthora muscae]|uniref:Uncharacterized protein n=1 Tax=Entomophthora muscae TaxID=34485 RepID=A0ACC2U7G1_9FUNG|nr:hypothetical protein DSO57_1004048 [Entomophthora muscae]